MKKKTTEEFIKQAKQFHGNKYSYSKTKYVDSTVKVEIVCKEHGSFWQKPSNHLGGKNYKAKGCPRCAGNYYKKTTEEVLEEIKETHGEKYDYSKVEYTGAKSKLEIICPRHGSFFKVKSDLVSKQQGCPSCSRSAGQKKVRNRKRSKQATKKVSDAFFKKAKNLHRNLDFSNSVYTKMQEPIEVECISHGKYITTPESLLAGKNCSKCYYDSLKSPRYTTQEYIEKVKKKHNYCYAKTYYTGWDKEIKVICQEHGEFKINAASHLRGQGCPKCSISSLEREVCTFLETSDIQFQTQKKFEGCEYKAPLLFDFYLPEYDILIECDGRQHYEPVDLFGGQEAFEETQLRDKIKIDWAVNNNYTILRYKYSDDFNSFTKRLEKAVEFKKFVSDFEVKFDYYSLDRTQDRKAQAKKDVYTVYEDVWRDKPEVIKSRALNLAGKTPNKIFARKTEVREVPTKIAMKFLEDSHIQGRLGAKVKLGLYHNEELVSLMTFGALRKNMGGTNKENHWELLRFCNKLNTSVVGGASKLLKYFERNYNPEYIRSYADKNWSKGNLYFKLGFTKVRESEPSYYYVIDGVRKNRFNFRKSKLIKQGFDPEKTEKQIMKEQGHHRIYDSGTIVFEKT